MSRTRPKMERTLLISAVGVEGARLVTRTTVLLLLLIDDCCGGGGGDVKVDDEKTSEDILSFCFPF